MTEQKIKEFAIRNGYDGAIPNGFWRGYEVYEPTLGNQPTSIGPPLMILVKGEKIRMTTPEESYERIDDLPDDIDEIEE